VIASGRHTEESRLSRLYLFFTHCAQTETTQMRYGTRKQKNTRCFCFVFLCRLRFSVQPIFICLLTTKLPHFCEVNIFSICCLYRVFHLVTINNNLFSRFDETTITLIGFLKIGQTSESNECKANLLRTH